MKSSKSQHPGSQTGIAEGHQARKRFGQNFLEDPQIISQIVAAINPRANDNLVEIGPGLGAITRLLIEPLNQLHVIELDRDLIPFLIARFEQTGKLNIHQQDALRFDFQQLVNANATHTADLRIVGNLPYNISTPLIFHLLDNANIIADMHFMLQKEVVDRLAAEPNSKAYGRLSIMVQYYCQVEALFEVPPNAFNPPPKVNSAIVRLTPHKDIPYPCKDVALLKQAVNQAFSMRRKTLRNSLKGMITTAAMEALGIDPNLRAECLSVAKFVDLVNAVCD